ncbi:MAG: 3,4-dihydroxy-2-butanone-4-phosphate synthase [Spirochaetota bacterium]
MRTQEKYIFGSIPEILEDLKQGKMIILVDDEDRENEGDLVIPADNVKPEIINFMAKYGRGLICLPMNESDLKRLNLTQMVNENTSNRGTAFTVSIEAKEGVSTGISAYDRAHTILTAINPDSKPEDLAKPGHIFPLKSHPGGVLIRPGQTEGSVELSKMAGFSANAVICEIMDEDGTMARLPRLFDFAEEHKLKITTIKDLIIHKFNNDNIIRKIDEQSIKLQGDIPAQLYIYKSDILNEWYMAVIYGNINKGEIPAYIHKQSIVSDTINILVESGKNPTLSNFINESIETDKGVLVFLCNETLEEVYDELSQRYNEDTDNIIKNEFYMFKWLRNLGVTSSILKDLSINSIEIKANNLEKINEMSKFGINIRV